MHSIIDTSTQSSGLLIAEITFFILVLKFTVPWLEQLIASLKALEDEFISNETDLRFQSDTQGYIETVSQTPVLRTHLFAARPLF